MILVDALNIKGGGCGVLLNYLIKALKEEEVHPLVLSKKAFHFENELKYNQAYDISKFPSYVINRPKILKQILSIHQIKTLLCFGHFPPPMKLKGTKVFTYFHNSFLINQRHPPKESFQQQAIHFLKKKYFKKHLNNTDIYFVQTPLVKEIFLETYPIAETRVVVLPFYDESKINSFISSLEKESQNEEVFIYPSSAAPHKNHLKLIKAWEILADRNIFPKLKITVPNEKRATLILDNIKTYKKKNIKIENIGTVSYDEMLREIQKANFCIFPSLLETLGLPLVESAKLGKKILVSDLDYVKHIVTPSLTFNQNNPVAIADAVEIALKSKLKVSASILKNDISNLKNHLIYSHVSSN